MTLDQVAELVPPAVWSALICGELVGIAGATALVWYLAYHRKR